MKKLVKEALGKIFLPKDFSHLTPNELLIKGVNAKNPTVINAAIEKGANEIWLETSTIRADGDLYKIITAYLADAFNSRPHHYLLVENVKNNEREEIALWQFENEFTPVSIFFGEIDKIKNEVKKYQ